MRALAFAAVALIAIGGCSSQAASTPTPAPSAAPVAASPEDAFVEGILATPGLTTTMARQEMLGIGRSICDAIGVPQISREVLITTIGSTRFGPEVGEVFVSNAEMHLCPENRYASFGTPAASSAPAAAAGPVGSFTAGTFEVGVDIAAGKYKTSGGDTCYWARLAENDGSSGDILDNGLGAGPQTVTVRDGEYFETQRCGTWQLQP